MTRWLTALLVALAVLFPSAAYGQTPITLSRLHVELWPEYDQPSMLVIYDFQVAEGTELPVGVTIRFPKDANLVAVAVHQDASTLMNADYLESPGGADWQAVVVQVQSPTTYRVEYFQPLTKSDSRRSFVYAWDGAYAVEALSVTVRMPADAAIVSATPELQRGESDGATYFMGGEFGALAVGERFEFALEYSRTTDALVAPPEGLGPAEPLDASTPGRIMLSNYLPYVLIGLGVILVLGGGVYVWQSSRAGRHAERPRHRSEARNPSRPGDVYCHQCGTRAEPSDKFCRVCGSRLHPPE
jgi:hypothetical protein